MNDTNQLIKDSFKNHMMINGIRTTDISLDNLINFSRNLVEVEKFLMSFDENFQSSQYNNQILEFFITLKQEILANLELYSFVHYFSHDQCEEINISFSDQFNTLQKQYSFEGQYFCIVNKETNINIYYSVDTFEEVNNPYPHQSTPITIDYDDGIPF